MKGARVVGFTNWFRTGRGTEASVVALPATNVVIPPDGLPSTELTTVGVNGLTAWRGLADLNLRTGDTLVITGAAGGVGGFATELAVVRGLTVIAAVREDARWDAQGKARGRVLGTQGPPRWTPGTHQPARAAHGGTAAACGAVLIAQRPARPVPGPGSALTVHSKTPNPDRCSQKAASAAR